METSIHSTKIAGYFFLASAAAPAFGRAFFLMVVTLDLVRQEHFFMSSIVFSSSIALQTVANPIIARLIRSMPNKLDAICIIITRSLLFALSVVLISMLVLETHALGVVVALLAYMLAGSFDSVLISKCPEWADSLFGIDYARSSAILNLIGRGSLALSPLVASSFLNGDVVFPLCILAIFAVLSAFSPIWVWGNSDDGQNDRPSVQSEKTARFQHWSLLAKWYIAFLFFANFSIAALSFIVLAAPQAVFDGPIIYAIIYGTFLFVQCLIGLGAVPVADGISLSGPRWIFVSLAIVVLIFGMTETTSATVVCAVLIGLLYSFIMPMLSAAAFGKFPKDRFREYVNTGKAAGRAASLASTWLAGLAISVDVGINTLIVAIGIVGLILSFPILVFERKAIGHESQKRMPGSGI